MEVKLLPTPNGDDANNISRSSGTFSSLTREVYTLATSRPCGTTLLPTPTRSDSNGPGEHGKGTDLRTAVSLLPTPRARATGGTSAAKQDVARMRAGLRTRPSGSPMQTTLELAVELARLDQGSPGGPTRPQSAGGNP